MANTETKAVRVRVIESEGQYLGQCLDYPVMTHGRTVEELAENVERALTLYLSGVPQFEPGEGERESQIAIRVELPKVGGEEDES